MGGQTNVLIQFKCEFKPTKIEDILSQNIYPSLVLEQEACVGKRKAGGCCHTPRALTLIGGLNKWPHWLLPSLLWVLCSLISCYTA
jgi:hypothetical protein